jgi:signal transduction histidine kinase
MPSLRARFLLLLAGLGALVLVPWVVTEELRRATDGFAAAIQDAGSLRYRILQIHLELDRAHDGPGARKRLETLMAEQREVLQAAVSGDPVARVAPCPTPEVCGRLRRHLKKWDADLEPRFRQTISGAPVDRHLLATDVLLEVNEIDLTVRATATAVQERTERAALLGLWAGGGSIVLVALVAAGIWQVFARVRRLRTLVAAGDEKGLLAQNRKTDELDGLARALGNGIVAERERRAEEAERAEELARSQLATRSVADALSAWLAGEATLDRALSEVARATGHERAELVMEQRAPGAWRNRQLEWAGKHLGTLRVAGTDAHGQEQGDVLLETLTQIFAIATLADRLLTERAAKGSLAVALGTLGTSPDAAELRASLEQLVAHDAAVIELFDSERRVDDAWALLPDRVERLPAGCDGPPAEGAEALSADSAGGCPALRQRCPGAQLAVRLDWQDRAIGALYLARAAGPFDTNDLRAAQAIAPVVASALARVQLEARVRFAEQWSTLGAFGRLLAHEIKNPLNSLGLELSLLERRVGRLSLSLEDLERISGSISVVKSELARLTSLTNEYLTMSPKSGALEVTPVDLNEVVASVVRAHAASMESRDIQLVDETGSTPAVVLGHPNKLKQLVHNVLGNAIEAMASADVRVATVSIRRLGSDWELCVRDTGPGIADPVAIFAPGFTTKASGTGMGLAISQQIARQHGGRLLARVVEAGGTEFTLSLSAHEPGPPN